MYRYILALATASVLAACGDGDPLNSQECGTGAGNQPLVAEAECSTEEEETTAANSVATLPGTDEPAPNVPIFRTEAQNTESGDGFANAWSYNEATNTFFVEGVDFDGDQPGGTEYNVATLGTVGGYSLFEAPVSVPDAVTGNPIPQNDTLAIYGVGASGETEFAIVRTGHYFDYGFGGFMYQRSGDVTLPTEGQAIYTGGYAGLVDFDGKSGIQVIEGDATIQIDVGAFSGNCDTPQCSNAIHGYIENRRVLDADGNDITAAALVDIDENNPPSALPVIVFTVGPNSMDANGEMTNAVTSTIDGNVWESGNYYALMSGDHTTNDGEIVGIVVTTAQISSGVTRRETGGFVVVR